MKGGMDKMSTNTAAKRQVVFTRCPVGGGTEILLQKGWLKEAFEKVGAEIIMLQSLPEAEHVKHYTQEAPLTFRDGGNVPPIWSRSNGTRTKVIGLTAIKQSHAIIVAPDSGIHSPEQLRGKRLSVPRFDVDHVDPMRAMVVRGYKTVLDAYGISSGEVTFVDIAAAAKKNFRHADSDEGTRSQGPNDSNFIPQHIEELEALQKGEIDALFSHRSLVGQIEAKGLGRILIDITKTGLSNVNNIYPSVITVDEDFARENRDIVVIYLKELLRTAQWVRSNHEEALQIAAKGQYGATYENLLSTRSEEAYKEYTPSFSPELTALLKQQKDFLLENHFIERDFDLDAWLDPGFLEEARKASKI